MYACADCRHIDKTRKEEGGAGSYRYGCNAPGRTYIVGCIRIDNELKWQGGSCWSPKEREPEQLTFSDVL